MYVHGKLQRESDGGSDSNLSASQIFPLGYLSEVQLESCGYQSLCYREHSATQFTRARWHISCILNKLLGKR
jgi:hypothetical protein